MNNKVKKGNVFCENCKYYSHPKTSIYSTYLGNFPCLHKKNKIEIKTPLKIYEERKSIYDANKNNNCKLFEERQGENNG